MSSALTGIKGGTRDTHPLLGVIDSILVRGDLTDYQHAQSARADCLRRLGRRDESATAYHRALSLTTHDVERRFLERRLFELPGVETKN